MISFDFVASFRYKRRWSLGCCYYTFRFWSCSYLGIYMKNCYIGYGPICDAVKPSKWLPAFRRNLDLHRCLQVKNDRCKYFLGISPRDLTNENYALACRFRRRLCSLSGCFWNRLQWPILCSWNKCKRIAKEIKFKFDFRSQRFFLNLFFNFQAVGCDCVWNATGSYYSFRYKY